MIKTLSTRARYAEAYWRFLRNEDAFIPEPRTFGLDDVSARSEREQCDICFAQQKGDKQMKEQAAFRVAQRKWDNALPEEERDIERVCRMCSEWVPESGFRKREAHTCIECDAWAAELEEAK